MNKYYPVLEVRKTMDADQFKCFNCGSVYHTSFSVISMPNNEEWIFYSRFGNIIFHVSCVVYELGPEYKHEVDLLLAHPEIFRKYDYNTRFEKEGCPYCGEKWSPDSRTVLKKVFTDTYDLSMKKNENYKE